MPIKPRSLPPDRAPGDPLRVLAQLAGIAAAIEHELKRQFDMSRNEYDVLIILERGLLPQKSLCVHTQSSPAAVSRWLTRLDREGWVTRQHTDNNQRDFISHLSRRGINQLCRIRAHIAGALRPMADTLTAEEEQMLLHLEKNMIRMQRQPSDPNSTIIQTDDRPSGS